MKELTFILCLFVSIATAQSPNTWTEVNGIGLTTPASAQVPNHTGGSAFTIGNLAYINTGRIAYTWTFDPSTATFTKLPYSGFSGYSYLIFTAAFSIGTKGYIVTGYTGNTNSPVTDEVWCYDQLTGSWTQMALFPGGVRQFATAFTINGKGYVATGDSLDAFSFSTYKNDLWEYDPSLNNWNQKNSLQALMGRSKAFSFSIGSYGYLGCGENYNFNPLQDFWQYDPANDTWAQKAAFPGGPRKNCIGFALGNKGFAGMGETINYQTYADFFGYDPAINSWVPLQNFPGTTRIYASSFTVGNKGYAGYGESNFSALNDLWMYDPSTGNWSSMGGQLLTWAQCNVSFSIKNSGFLCGGTVMSGSSDKLYQYNAAVGHWMQKANLAGPARTQAAGFNIGNKGYIGTGTTGSAYLNDFWEYDLQTDSWTQKAQFPGAPRNFATGFSIGYKGYMGTGRSSNTYFNDFWEYDSHANTWNQVASFSGTKRRQAVSFSIGNKGYLGTGFNEPDIFTPDYAHDFWEYDPATDAWTQKTNFPSSARYGATGFSRSNRGYIGAGTDGAGTKNDFYEYNPSTNTWTTCATIPGGTRTNAGGFQANGKGYVYGGTGNGYPLGNQEFYDCWEYTPVCISPDSVIYKTGDSLTCGDSIMLFAAQGDYYRWALNGSPIPGATNYFYYATVAGNYVCEISNACDTVISNYISIVNNPFVEITASGTTTFCEGDSVILSATPGMTSYQWYRRLYAIPGATTSSFVARTPGRYYCVAEIAALCPPDTSNIIIVRVPCIYPFSEGERIAFADNNSPLEIYPNPSQGIFTLQAPAGELKIYDAKGKIVFVADWDAKQKNIDLHELREGIYLISLQASGQMFTKRLFLVR